MRLVIRYVLSFAIVNLNGWVGGEGEDWWKVAWTGRAMKASVVEKQGLEEKRNGFAIWTDSTAQVLQRVYKYGGQPFVRDYLAKNHGSTFDRTFGEKTGKAMMSSFAGR